MNGDATVAVVGDTAGAANGDTAGAAKDRTAADETSDPVPEARRPGVGSSAR
jgi:hypothetical protein